MRLVTREIIIGLCLPLEDISGKYIFDTSEMIGMTSPNFQELT